MKLLVSALLLAAASAAFAQNQTGPPAGAGGVMSLDLEAVRPDNQAGCPVVLTDASLSRPATLLPVDARKPQTPDLSLSFRNASGKAIESLEVAVRLTGKTDKYQLDATSFVFHLSFSGADAADQAAEQLRQIQLPKGPYPYGVNGVSLKQVTFADGSFWTAAGHPNCKLSPRSSERIGAQ